MQYLQFPPDTAVDYDFCINKFVTNKILKISKAREAVSTRINKEPEAAGKAAVSFC